MFSRTPAPRLPLGLLLFAIALLPAGEAPPPFVRFGLPVAPVAGELQGIDAVHVLSDRWVVIGIDLTPRIRAEVERLSDGTYQAAIDAWVASEKGGKPNWGARKRMHELRDRLWPAARAAAGETALAVAGSWRVSSPDDPRYAAPITPLRIAGLPISLGQGGDHDGTPRILHGCQTYLELPTAMQAGRTYRIALEAPAGPRSCAIRYEPQRTRSSAIKVNQVGYRSGDPLKVAYLGAWIPGVGPLPIPDRPRWRLLDQAGRESAAGVCALRDDAARCAPRPDKQDDPAKRPLITGERLFEADFSAVSQPGSYVLVVEGFGCSWPIRIADDVYGEAWYTTMRGFFQQRGSSALERACTAWTRPRLHTDPVYESLHIPFGAGGLGGPKGYERFDVIGATLDASRSTPEVVGGYYDAADWDRNLAHYTIAFDQLALLDRRPGAFPDRQLAIPESGNGVPDVLDEIEFGLRCWLASQDAAGAVSGMIEANSHYRGDDPAARYAFSRRTRFSSLIFAAAAAWYARHATATAPALAQRYLEASRRAFAWGGDPANSLGRIAIPAKRERGRGAAYEVAWEETDAMSEPYELLARQQLWLATGDEAYLARLAELAARAPKPYEWPWSTRDHSGYFVQLLATPAAGAASLPGVPAERLAALRARLPAELGRTLAERLVLPARELAGLVETMPYRMSWKRDKDYWMGWGATCMYNANRALWIAETLDPDPGFRRAILANAAAMLGANPLGLSWTTGLGCAYPAVIQHWSSENDGIDDPVPGLTIYGVTDGFFGALREQVWRAALPGADGAPGMPAVADPGTIPVWRRWSQHSQLNTAQCEFTVWETMAAAALTAGILVPDGWQPPGPPPGPRHPSHLFGRWHLP